MNAEIIQFLKELQVNNNREWFQANKSRYDVLRKNFIENVQLLIDRIGLFDPEVAGLDAKDCLFRIYRDIRFSPDKTPYKRHFAAYIASCGGRGSERGGYYIHLEPGGCMLSGGVWCPPPVLLKMLRKDIYENIEELVEILENPQFKKTYPVMEGEVLKRMPVGYPSDFEYGEILRHKDFCVASYKPDEYFFTPDWLDKVVEDFKLLYPFNRFLNYTVDEYLGRV
ncbi:MAG: DUF2461 domain-containing protein [Parabacteroides sp.]|nr:DUF2461 domain-containing protein [Parabacteroides sp.]